MKRKIKGKHAQDKSTDDASLQSVASRVIRKKHTVQKQYPARVGYHGTDDEKDLNPEE